MNARAFLTTSKQIGASMCIGDLVCQILEQRYKSPPPTSQSSTTTPQYTFNTSRSLTMLTTGFFISAPWSHMQYQLFEKISPGTHARAVVQKVALSSAFAPISISLLLTSVLILNGKTGEDVMDKLKKDLVPMWQMGALYWPVVLGFNFRCVEIGRRPLVAALVGSVWSVYSAYVANNGEEVVVEEDGV